MGPDDLRVHVQSRKMPCVLDPALVLGTADGFSLAVRLTQVVEPWLTRAFWQVIDASEWFSSEQAHADATLPPRAEAMNAWIALRDQTDAGSWPFRWIGDRLAESQLKDHADAGLIARYESLAEALALHVQTDWPGQGAWPVVWDPMQASLDTLALSAALDAAVVLTAVHDGEVPWPVRRLHESGITAVALDPLPHDSLFATERALLREALAAAGLATLTQRLPPLAVVHVMAGGPSPGAWANARAWWYAL